MHMPGKIIFLAALILCVGAAPVSSQKANQKNSTEDADESKLRPLTIDEISGEWVGVKIGGNESRDAKIKIKFKDEKSKRLVLEGKYKNWEQEGEVADG